MAAITDSPEKAVEYALVFLLRLVLMGEKYEQVGKLGKGLGLVWGGDWKGFVDLPHFETEDAREALKKLSDI